MANWNILGAGAIGHFFAEKLLKSGQHASLVQRPEQATTAHHFCYENLHGHCTSNIIMAQPQLTSKCDFLLITLKAQQVLPALLQLQEQIDKYCCIILLHNGMGTAEQVEKLFPHNAIIQATTANGVLRIAPDHIRHTGAGITWFGAFNNKAKRYTDIAEQLSALDEVYWSDTVREKLWLKLVINCAINPLTAIHQCQNGKLATQPLHDEVVRLVEELTLVCNKINLPWNNSELLQHVDEVIARTAANYSSMQQDWLAERPSEIEFITGHVLRVAQAYAIEMPANAAMYAQVKAHEHHYQNSAS
jgi:2-dehydropantoate 2-reductase